MATGLSRLRRWRRKLTPRLLWDLLMVYLAFLNLGLILFDLAYFWLRPVALRVAPAVVRIYDPVKGVDPHPLVPAYLDLAAEVGRRLEAGETPAALAGELGRLRQLSTALQAEDAYGRSGPGPVFLRLRVAVRRHLEEEPDGIDAAAAAVDPLDRFWSAEADAARLRARADFFRRELEPRLAEAYLRGFDLEGGLIDRFWMLDLPFLAFFTVEFFTRWLVAVRRSTYGRWFFFPIFNWYDLLGIVPLRQFRIFRLFRIASIYLRLRRSELTAVGDDPLSRAVRYLTNIISEEVSDMVALRILNETQAEIRGGTHRRIVRSVMERHRDALAAELTVQARSLVSSPEVRTQARQFLDINLERAVDSAEALRRLPLPERLLRPLTRTIGEAVFDSFADTLEATLSRPEGIEALERLVVGALDGLVEEVTAGELDRLVSEISLEVLERVKQAVAVRKWALPERPPRRLFPDDLGSERPERAASRAGRGAGRDATGARSPDGAR